MIQHTYLFPGQGSQKLGMGKELFGKYPQFMKQADGILGYSIEELCLNGTQEQLNQTQYTQPALYTVEALSYLSRCEITGEKPDYIAGHSLGEFAALFAANVYDFDEGLYLVAKRGELMAQATGGGMAAVIGLTLSQVTDVIARNRLKEIEIANLNSETQIIIAGPCDSIVKTEEVFRREKDLIKYVPLKVSGAFHSSYMQKARDQFYQVLAGISFRTPKIKVISNCFADFYEPGRIRDTLAEQMTNPVRWYESIQMLLDKNSDMNFIEIGPGKVLTFLARQIKKEKQERDFRKSRSLGATSSDISSEIKV